MMHLYILLLCTILLIFLLSITGSSKQDKTKLLLDFALILLTLASLGHIFLNYEYVVTRYSYVQSLTLWDFVMGWILSLILLEASRRGIGWALPITAG